MSQFNVRLIRFEQLDIGASGLIQLRQRKIHLHPCNATSNIRQPLPLLIPSQFGGSNRYYLLFPHAGPRTLPKGKEVSVHQLAMLGIGI